MDEEIQRQRHCFLRFLFFFLFNPPHVRIHIDTLTHLSPILLISSYRRRSPTTITSRPPSSSISPTCLDILPQSHISLFFSYTHSHPSSFYSFSFPFYRRRSPTTPTSRPPSSSPPSPTTSLPAPTSSSLIPWMTSPPSRTVSRPSLPPSLLLFLFQ